ncbi:MAG: hypothetical protein ACRDSG_13915, partial [Pseudonocardiaceae bacterium]
MGPAGPVRRPSTARWQEPGPTCRAPGALRALLVALIAALIAGVALLGLAAPALAGEQPSPTPPTPTHPAPAQEQGLPVSRTQRNVDGT